MEVVKSRPQKAVEWEQLASTLNTQFLAAIKDVKARGCNTKSACNCLKNKQNSNKKVKTAPKGMSLFTLANVYKLQCILSLCHLVMYLLTDVHEKIVAYCRGMTFVHHRFRQSYSLWRRKVHNTFCVWQNCSRAS